MSHREEDRQPSVPNPAAPPVAREEVLSFPTSVQDKLDEARALLRRDRPEDALAALRDAGRELASSSPELFALIVASHMGARRLVFEESETVTRTVERGRYVLGVRVGHDAETATTETSTTRTVRFG